MVNPSIILAWTITWTEGPGGLRSWGCIKSDVIKLGTMLTLEWNPHSS